MDDVGIIINPLHVVVVVEQHRVATIEVENLQESGLLQTTIEERLARTTGTIVHIQVLVLHRPNGKGVAVGLLAIEQVAIDIHLVEQVTHLLVLLLGGQAVTIERELILLPIHAVVDRIACGALLVLLPPMDTAGVGQIAIDLRGVREETHLARSRVVVVARGQTRDSVRDDLVVPIVSWV